VYTSRDSGLSFVWLQEAKFEVTLAAQMVFSPAVARGMTISRRGLLGFYLQHFTDQLILKAGASGTPERLMEATDEQPFAGRRSAEWGLSLAQSFIYPPAQKIANEKTWLCRGGE